MEYVLTTNNITKKYKDFKALDGLTMNVPKGAIYGMVGKNGSGKTTLIRIICGLQKPTSGEYSLYGSNNTDKDFQKKCRRIGAVVETPSIYLEMTAQENLKQQLSLIGTPDYSSIPALLELVGLRNTGDKKAKNFSLGMKQRLGIAIALAGNPDFIILDEPINGLDPQGIVEMRELILKMSKEMGITILISSHILDELSKLATHYGFIDKGRILKEMSAEELENECRKCLIARVSDVKIFTRYLDKIGVDYSVISDSDVYVYSKLEITKTALELADENCTIISLTEKDESLESFYINLVGGADND